VVQRLQPALYIEGKIELSVAVCPSKQVQNVSPGLTREFGGQFISSSCSAELVIGAWRIAAATLNVSIKIKVIRKLKERRRQH